MIYKGLFKQSKHSTKGFTFVELMITLAIGSILLFILVPSLTSLVQARQLDSVSEHFYTELRQARAESLRRKVDVYVAFQTGTQWCYGFSDTGTCDCSTANSCQVNGVERTVSSQNHTGISFSQSGFIQNFTHFDSFRGTADDPGSFTFQRNGKSHTIDLNAMGLVHYQ